MKLSEYLKSHGAYGALRSRQTGTELHFNLEPGQTRAPVVLDVGGLSIEGYIEVQRRHGIASDEEFDMTFALRLGEGPVVQAVAVMPAKAEVDVSKDPRFTPGPAPNLNPIPAPKAVELPRTPVDRFDPGPGPELNELPEARMMVPSAPEEEEDGAGPNEVERAMAAEFAPEATEKKAEAKEVKEEKEGKKEAMKTVRR